MGRWAGWSAGFMAAVVSLAAMTGIARAYTPGTISTVAGDLTPAGPATNLGSGLSTSKIGVPSTVRAHYVAADGSQGVVISEADDLEEAPIATS